MGKNLKISKKVMMIVGSLLGMVVIAVIIFDLSLEGVKDQTIERVADAQLDGFKKELKTVVQATALSFGEAVKNLKTDDEKIAEIRRLNEPIRFFDTKNGYFFIYSKAGVVVSLPPKKKLQGKNLIHVKDKDGVYFVKDLGLGAEAGGKFVYYGFPKPNEEESSPKLAYAEMIPGTEWWIGTGVYIDSVDKQKLITAESVEDSIQTYLLIGFGIILGYGLIIVLPLVMVFTKMITRPLRLIEECSRKFGEGDFSESVDYVSKDEIGAVAEAFRLFAKNQLSHSRVAASIAEGDLTVKPEVASEKDRLGNALVMMIDKLKETMQNIQVTSLNVDNGAKQVSASSSSLSEDAIKSAAAIEEISSSMTQIQSQVKTSAENANTANSLSTATLNAANNGATEMKELQEAMKAINESSGQIAKIIKVIDDIAFQTNLLALNAAVEAARAGIHGKGFAVVAEEVRSLAGRSAKAANETEGLIQDTVTRINNGDRIAAKTGESLGAIVNQVTEVNTLVDEIASAANEQATGFNQIAQGIEQIDSVIQSNTANAEETSSASEELSSQATELQVALASFKIESVNRKVSTASSSQIKRKPLPVAPKLAPAAAPKTEDALLIPDSEWGQDEPVISLDDDLGKY